MGNNVEEFDDRDMTVDITLEDGTVVTCAIETIFSICDKDYIALLTNLEDEEDVEEVLYDYNNNDYFDMSVISYVWDDAYDVATNYIDECCNIESWLTSYIDYDGLGEAIIEDGYYYELCNGRVVQYNY